MFGMPGWFLFQTQWASLLPAVPCGCVQHQKWTACLHTMRGWPVPRQWHGCGGVLHKMPQWVLPKEPGVRRMFAQNSGMGIARLPRPSCMHRYQQMPRGDVSKRPSIEHTLFAMPVGFFQHKWCDRMPILQQRGIRSASRRRRVRGFVPQMRHPSIRADTESGSLF